ncbi:MAG: hypothetical protein JXL84_21960 [Deltaproteobacteria bacterium]|nr:hypothetical protein [Deltaproteobacteria bacterium]
MTARKTNHYAIAGFLLPFAAAGLACVFVLFGRNGLLSFRFWIPFFTVIPLILCLGLVSSLKSIPRITDLGDKDYAYSGLVLNIFFVIVYLYAVIRCLFFLS